MINDYEFTKDDRDEDQFEHPVPKPLILTHRSIVKGLLFTIGALGVSMVTMIFNDIYTSHALIEMGEAQRQLGADLKALRDNNAVLTAAIQEYRETAKAATLAERKKEDDVKQLQSQLEELRANADLDIESRQNAVNFISDPRTQAGLKQALRQCADPRFDADALAAEAKIYSKWTDCLKRSLISPAAPLAARQARPKPKGAAPAPK